MAYRLGVSTRALQKIFAERGETLMARLWGERVNRAARLLSAPEAADRSITDIAFAAASMTALISAACSPPAWA